MTRSLLASNSFCMGEAGINPYIQTHILSRESSRSREVLKMWKSSEIILDTKVGFNPKMSMNGGRGVMGAELGGEYRRNTA